MSAFRYHGKRVVLTGAHSGMGASTARMLARLGTEVHALDIANVPVEVARSFRADVGNPRFIDAAIAEIGAPVHCLFNCAGIPHTFPPLEVMKVDFLGPRHLTETVLPLTPRGGAVAHIASVAGSGWTQHLEPIRELIATADFQKGLAWCEGRCDLVGAASPPSSAATRSRGR